MGTHNICHYKEVDKKYTGCNLKTTKLLDCALIGVCAVIRSNMVYGSESLLDHGKLKKKKYLYRIKKMSKLKHNMHILFMCIIMVGSSLVSQSQHKNIKFYYGEP